MKASKRDIQRKKETLNIDIKCINEDYNNNYQRKVLMHKELKEVKETIEIINDELSSKEEEVLRLRIKIRQTDIEKEKLEAEQLALRKLIGKQSRGKNA